MQTKTQSKTSSVFLLGASGFVGQRVWKQGAEHNATLTALRRRGQVDSAYGDVIQGDISSFDWSFLDENHPDAIIHTARISGKTAIGRYLAGWRGWQANRSLERWRMKTELEHRTAKHEHNQSKHISPVRLVFASGSLVYGDCGTAPVFESNPLHPIAFQRDYVRAEQPFLYRVNQPGTGLCIARLPWIYGAGSWFAQFYIRTARRDGYVTQYGSGKQLMSLIHVEDAAGMMLELALKHEASGVYNLIAGPAVSHGDFCRMVARGLGLPVKKMPESQVWSKFGKTVTEALTFSSDVRTEREELQSYTLKYPNLETGIQKVITELG